MLKVNKFISKVLIVLVCLSLVLTGCTESKEPMDTVSKSTENENQRERRVRSRADIFGRVKSIIGNEVVLEIAEMPERIANQGEGQEGRGEGAARREGNSGGESPGGRGMREMKLTGETVTLLIPIGIPITTRSQKSLKEIDLADIYVGATLQIWFEDGDAEKKAIARVTMMQGRE